MSTVDKKTADKVVSGEFSEEGIIAIIEYSNIFNGALAYKLVYPKQNIIEVQRSIACRSSSIYWLKERKI